MAPQRRYLVWTSDSGLLAVASNSDAVKVYDTAGNQVGDDARLEKNS